MELAERVVKAALKKGATEAEAFMQKAKTIQTEFTSHIESFKTVESVGIGLRVALGKRIAMYSTSILNPKEIGEVAGKAVKIAKVAPEDSNWKQMNRKFGKGQAEGYYDERLEGLGYDEIVSRLTDAAKLITDYDKRVKPARGFLSILTSNIMIANGNGDSAERKETSIRVWMRTKASESGMESTGNEHQEAKFWREMKFDDLAAKAAERAIRFLSAKSMPSVKTSLIMRNQVFADVLEVLLGPAINADWVQKGRSPLASKLGTEIASKNINVIDDGLMRGGWKTRLSDDEGCPTQRTPIIERGVLKSYVYDSYTALKANVESTGNAERFGYWVRPQPSISNLVFKKGNVYPEEMIQETRSGVYVEESIGQWLSNPVSGNLNATISHGHIVKNGKLVQPIKGVVISGNFYELLKGGFESIGNDLKNSGGTYAPTVKLAQVTIAGE